MCRLKVKSGSDDKRLLMSDRRSQWAGAKALAKLIKPRKESSRERGGDRDKEMDRERERAKSAPDIPLPPTPPLFPPETPPPVPQRMGSDSQDGSHLYSNHNNHSPSLGPQSPSLTPITRGKHAHSVTLNQPIRTRLQVLHSDFRSFLSCKGQKRIRIPL